MKLNCLILIIPMSLIIIFNNAYAQEPNSILEWNITTNKETFYPGEPVLLTINIKNIGAQKEKIDFGQDGIGAFSIEIENSNNITVSEGAKIPLRGGLSRRGDVVVSPSQTSEKPIILNRWASTLLPTGQYNVILKIDYRLYSEDQKQPNTMVKKAGPIHKKELAINIEIIKTNEAEFKKILENLTSFQIKPEQITREWLVKSEIANEMIALTESDLAIPYQLQLLKIKPQSWFVKDAVNSLVKSENIEAAKGLVEVANEQATSRDGVQPYIIEGIYKLREKGKTEIISATNDFASKYQRPPIEQLPTD